MPYLNWIDDDKLVSSVKHLLVKAAAAKANTNIYKNVIDPFYAMFEIAGFESDYESWLNGEISRQAQKTLQNHIGDFHQNILGYSNKWINKRTGSVIDLVSDELKIIAEIKNKHNTLSGGKLADLNNSLDDLIMPKSSIYKGYTAYYVVIIPKTAKRYDITFTPSDKGKGQRCPLNENIREIDGASFYSMVTGYDNALEELFDIIPNVIFDLSDGKYNVDEKEKLKTFFIRAFGSLK